MRIPVSMQRWSLVSIEKFDCRSFAGKGCHGQADEMGLVTPAGQCIGPSSKLGRGTVGGSSSESELQPDEGVPPRKRTDSYMDEGGNGPSPSVSPLSERRFWFEGRPNGGGGRRPTRTALAHGPS
jgi:hypothetical protein